MSTDFSLGLLLRYLAQISYVLKVFDSCDRLPFHPVPGVFFLAPTSACPLKFYPPPPTSPFMTVLGRAPAPDHYALLLCYISAGVCISVSHFLFAGVAEYPVGGLGDEISICRRPIYEYLAIAHTARRWIG